MKLKVLKNYTDSILSSCEKEDYLSSMIDSLNEDLVYDRYQDTQPGGGMCEATNRENYHRYADELSNINSETVFGTLYQNADVREKELLDKLLDVCLNNYVGSVYVEANLVYQTLQFLNILCKTDFADKEFTAEDIDFILLGGKYFLNLVENSYDENRMEFSFNPDLNAVKSFLSEYGISSCKSYEDKKQLHNVVSSLYGLNLNKKRVL